VTVSVLAACIGVTLVVSSNGTATKPTVAAGGIISDLGATVGATVAGTKTVSGTEIVSAHGVASATVVSAGGMLRVSSGGTAVGTVLSGGVEAVSIGGIVSGAVTFKGTGGGTLIVSGTKGIAVSVSGFAKTDTIDLASFKFGAGEKLSFVEDKTKTKGTLTITDGALKATITLFGQYVAAGFKLSAAGAGTAITYTSAAAAHGVLAGGHT
jgi:autotransporter passenger strand-loop-strand repeat protein